MPVIAEIKRRSRQIVLPIVGASVIAYFAYHTVQGERGLLSYLRLSQEVRKADVALAELTARRERLENRVGLLDGTSLDLDMLEEQVRRTLNLAHPDDLILFLGPEARGRDE